MITLDELRRFTIARNFPRPTTLKRAIHKMEFVQADPIRSPARAQDLILRHRVKDYRAGDLERRYASLDIEEDVFIMYGFVTRSLQALMHPRSDKGMKKEKKKARLLLDFVRERGAVHPREVDEHFSHGKVENYWGGSSNATTHMLDSMHYRGLVRVARREKGIRVYAVRENDLNPPLASNDATGLRDEPAGGDANALSSKRLDTLVNVVVQIYAPLPALSLSFLIRQLRYAAPQWQSELTSALQRAKERLSHTRVDNVDWYWPANEKFTRITNDTQPDTVRLLAPFDPVVRDRHRFELLWNWVYRFEAYTPAAKRKLGYYAMPLLWRDRVIGWGNLTVRNGELNSEFGYVKTEPRDRVFQRELEAELNRMQTFLGL